MAHSDIIVIGGGQAGAQAIASLRQYGNDQTITLIGDEPVSPYQRPPLSKAYMKGGFAEERLFLKPADWYRDQKISYMLGNRAVAIDRDARTVALADGKKISYSTLIISTGARPRPLPIAGADGPFVFDLRTLGDVKAIKPHMKPGQRLAIIGAGYIGLEAAAVAREMGLAVTVLEREDRVLARVTSPVMSQFFQNEHERQGVIVRTAAQASALETFGDGAVSISLDGGDALMADLVLVGIGIIPNDQLAVQCGLSCADGIVVDVNGMTSDPAIYAAGDCTVRPLWPYGGQGRLESVHNAIEQGKCVAAKIMGEAQPTLDVPWFWSDQYDLKLQIAGLSHGFDDHVVRGTPEDRQFSVFYFKDTRLIAADAINSAPDYMVAKMMIAKGAAPDKTHLADLSVPIKDIAKKALAMAV
ncbi:MAG: FAD-dependent oxidoreductase [Pseudomonadota bacterium]